MGYAKKNLYKDKAEEANLIRLTCGSFVPKHTSQPSCYSDCFVGNRFWLYLLMESCGEGCFLSFRCLLPLC